MPRGQRIIAAGQDEKIFRLVVHGADDEIPQGEQPPIAGIQVDGGMIAVTFDGHPDGRLTIRTAESAGEAFLRTSAIAVSWTDHRVPEPIRRYASVIARSPVWEELWTQPGGAAPASGAQPHSADPSRPQHPLLKEPGSHEVQISERSVWRIVLWSLIAGDFAAALLLVVGGRRQPQLPVDPQRAERGHELRLSPLAVSTAGLALGVAVLAVAHFHFRMDDYSFLALATHYPFEMTGETRLLSTRVHYQLGVLLGGGQLWFALSNLAFLGAMSACWGLLLQRIGFSRDAAVMGAAPPCARAGHLLLLRQPTASST
jgi:hypothetical protein